MTTKQPKPGELEPIETASRDEIAGLQLKRLKWTLAHAYRRRRARSLVGPGGAHLTTHFFRSPSEKVLIKVPKPYDAARHYR